MGMAFSSALRSDLTTLAENFHTSLTTPNLPKEVLEKQKELVVVFLQATREKCTPYINHMNQARSQSGEAINDRAESIMGARDAISCWHQSFSFLNHREIRDLPEAHSVLRETNSTKLNSTAKTVDMCAKILLISHKTNTALPIRALEQLSKKNQKLEDSERQRLNEWVRRVELARQNWIDIDIIHQGLVNLVMFFNEQPLDKRVDFVKEQSDLGILMYRLREMGCKILDKPSQKHLKEIEQMKEGTSCEIDGEELIIGKRIDKNLYLSQLSHTAVFPIFKKVTSGTDQVMGFINFSINPSLPFIEHGRAQLTPQDLFPMMSLKPNRVRWHTSDQEGGCTTSPHNTKNLANIEWKTTTEGTSTEIDGEDLALAKKIASALAHMLLQDFTPLNMRPEHFVLDGSDQRVKGTKAFKMGPGDPKVIREFIHDIARKHGKVEKLIAKESKVGEHPFDGEAYRRALEITFESLIELDAKKPFSAEKIIEETSSSPHIKASLLALCEAAKQFHKKCEHYIMDEYELKNEQRAPAMRKIGKEILAAYNNNYLMGSLEPLNNLASIPAIAAAIAAECGFGKKQIPSTVPTGETK